MQTAHLKHLTPIHDTPHHWLGFLSIRFAFFPLLLDLLEQVDPLPSVLAGAEDAFEDEEFVAIDALVAVHIEHVEGDLKPGTRLGQHAE